MGDSDDEYGGRRERNKFQSERQPQRYEEPRRDWNDSQMRQSWSNRPGRGDDRYPASYGRRDRSYGSPRDSRDMSPPSKRRRDYDDRGDHDHRGRDLARDSIPSTTAAENCPTQPIMLTFKQFMSRLDEDISGSQANTKYTEYKLEFKKKQAKEFFDKHKDEEWYVFD